LLLGSTKTPPSGAEETKAVESDDSRTLLQTPLELEEEGMKKPSGSPPEEQG
jgi:hypothetical protein